MLKVYCECSFVDSKYHPKCGRPHLGCYVARMLMWRLAAGTRVTAHTFRLQHFYFFRISIILDGFGATLSDLGNSAEVPELHSIATQDKGFYHLV